MQTCADTRAGQESEKVLSYIDVLKFKRPVGDSVAVVGAGAAACLVVLTGGTQRQGGRHSYTHTHTHTHTHTKTHAHTHTVIGTWCACFCALFTF